MKDYRRLVRFLGPFIGLTVFVSKKRFTCLVSIYVFIILLSLFTKAAIIQTSESCFISCTVLYVTISYIYLFPFCYLIGEFYFFVNQGVSGHSPDAAVRGPLLLVHRIGLKGLLSPCPGVCPWPGACPCPGAGGFFPPLAFIPLLNFSNSQAVQHCPGLSGYLPV